MKLSEFMEKILKEANARFTVAIEFDLTLNDKCEIDKNGGQKVNFEVT